jgi:hypothetical protein
MFLRLDAENLDLLKEPEGAPSFAPARRLAKTSK